MSFGSQPHRGPFHKERRLPSLPPILQQKESSDETEADTKQEAAQQSIGPTNVVASKIETSVAESWEDISSEQLLAMAGSMQKHNDDHVKCVTVADTGETLLSDGSLMVKELEVAPDTSNDFPPLGVGALNVNSLPHVLQSYLNVASQSPAQVKPPRGDDEMVMMMKC